MTDAASTTTVAADGSITDPYRNFISVSRYARWREEDGRRETWTETVDRYIEFFVKHLVNTYGYDPEDGIFAEVRQAILTHQVMPSMRALMTAGPALERSHIASYNCSFIAVNDPRAFDEAMFILLNGTGVGFSVERHHVDQLPAIPAQVASVDKTLVVADSKEGWVESFRDLLSMLWNGDIPTWDLSLIRPSGAKLKTFGGRASGPGPLDELFRFAVDTFVAAAGRRLTSVEAHDLMCKVGDVVVSGGVRRSALISLSDLNDFDMAKAKTGSWWETHGHRRLANNSAVYTTKPSVTQFLDEWRNLIESQSGERGIFNLAGAQAHATKQGRDGSQLKGTNPCQSGGSRLLTREFGLARIDSLAGKEFHVWNGEQWSQSTAWQSGIKPVFRVHLTNGQQIELTADHRLACITGGDDQGRNMQEVEMRVEDLQLGQKIRPLLGSGHWEGRNIDPDRALLYGLAVGDGFVQRNGGTSVYWRINEEEVIKFLLDNGGQFADSDRVRVPGLRTEMMQHGFEFVPLPDRVISEEVFTWSSASVEAFLRGLFTANGGAMAKHARIDLKTTSGVLARQVQMLLLALRLPVYLTTNAPMEIEWPNGTYTSRESYDVNVSGQGAYQRFQSQIGFLHAHKSVALEGDFTFRAPRATTVKAIEPLGEMPVYDFTEPLTHWGWVNGLKSHNCGEILLRDNQTCNLSEVIITADDDETSLRRKVRLATIIGTWQSTLTDFNHLRAAWKANCDEERLLGVSLTGIYGNPLFNDPDDQQLPARLDELRDWAHRYNVAEASRLGINSSAAITCVKPSGTVSQLTGVSSGIHPWHSDHYVRTVRGNNSDPLTRLMKDSGVPHEPELMKPDDVTVFSFPIKAPAGAVTRDQVSALEHLRLWSIYRDHWTDHNPSITVNVRDEEWLGVGAWVFENWDSVGGIAFLPYSEHVYQQAPYQECDALTYQRLVSQMPASIFWEELPFYESEDATTGTQDLACTAGACEIVDLSA